QKRAFLPLIYRGEVRTWQLLTEPGAGSDLAGVTTTAIRDGDEYVINGQKIFVGSDNGADRIWMIAVTDPGGKRHEHLSWFMIDAALPGLTVPPTELRRTGRDGVPLSQHADTRDLLADIFMKTEVMRLFGLRNFWLTYAKRPRSYEGPQLSYYRKMTGLWMTGAILEAVGPAALTSDETWGAPEGFLELQQRNGIIAVHPGGTADIQRVSMARRIAIGRAAREAVGTVH